MTVTRPLALTPGEPAGVGCELAAEAWIRRGDGIPAFFLIDDPDRVASRLRLIDRTLPLHPITDPAEASRVFAQALPILLHPFPSPDRPGVTDAANGKAVADAIERAVELVRSGRASAVVTNPIQKETLYQAGFAHPGHTEFLAHLVGPDVTPVMLLASEALRVVPVTIHIPLSEVPSRLTTSAILTVARITAASLTRDFGIAAPRLAVAGLNPHAGEGGAIGHEDRDIIAPAVAALRADGIDAIGPLPADTMFHAEARAGYDVALGMYHDQVLVPLKTLDFWGGVNVTLGLPFVRTSPDHGTALNLAGTGRARPDSLIAALRLAETMVTRRNAAQRAGTAS
ncbi:4-hydroxythreonine-4-phosphate dehydrogenase PdxA [Thalassobaculum sp.]|uniref:4-hydroxythreonine-4-phosphate dehydrogenase PdxA n=1 Tax=Thalassobaculum sp. TaxID=2022740 RepID=UPI0032EF4CAD